MNDAAHANLLEGLIRQYSPTYAEAGAAAYLVNWMTGQGFRAFIDEAGNAVGTRGDGPNEVIDLAAVASTNRRAAGLASASV